MESLRKQLHETQDALNEKTILNRKMKAEQAEALTNWKTEKQDYENQLRRLEQENFRLQRQKDGRKEDGHRRRASIANTLLGTVGDDAETVLFTKPQMRDAELKYQRVKDELAEKTKLCETLQRQLTQGIDGTSGPTKSAGLPDLTDDHVVAGWKKLRGQIRDVSRRKFNKPQAVSSSEEQGYKQLSTHWIAYMSRDELAGYMIQALIWRCLHTSLFEKYCRVWGRELGNTAAKLGGFFMGKAADKDFQEWRMLTGAMFDKTCDMDATIMDEMVQRMFDALAPFIATVADTTVITKALKEIVVTAAELGAIFARSQFVPLMSDKPGSDLMRGFTAQDATMEIKGKYGDGTTVDMMISPCLLKRETDYTVLVKAEVIC